jgi:hypothetical protein
VQLAERNTKITERAVILIEHVIARPHAETASDPYFHAGSVLVFTLKNFGNTVAHAVGIKGSVHYLTGSRPFSAKADSTVAPQGRSEWVTDTLFVNNREAELRRANEGDNAVRYEVEAMYRDVFGQNHTYKAKGVYIPVLRGFTIETSTSD